MLATLCRCTASLQGQTGNSCWRALQAAGAVIALVDHVVAASRQREAAAAAGGGGGGGGVPAGFAICRPPGHHSLPSGAMGFCIFGNVSIAARYAQKQYGLQRVSVAGVCVEEGGVAVWHLRGVGWRGLATAGSAWVPCNALARARPRLWARRVAAAHQAQAWLRASAMRTPCAARVWWACPLCSLPQALTSD